MQNYAINSIETHLFFARIMREHALFLMAGFPSKEKEWIEKADFFREEFENLLCEVVNLADGRVTDCFINSSEAITEFTIPAEQKTCLLTGIPIDSTISEKTMSLCAVNGRWDGRELAKIMFSINEKALNLVNGLIEFKECLLKDLGNCTVYNTNYPLLIQHILREAKLYKAFLEELLRGRIPRQSLCDTERFWNQIMMEHALFIRGLLDPSEEELIKTAHCFAGDYRKLLETARRQDCRATAQLSLNKTMEYRDFKATSANGILGCNITSLILPLLADHVLREANHYIRLLNGCNLSKR